ncbi:MAG: hypothetical protein SOZ56_10510 [Oscillospiraceae bacterium]|nr:hypothetical protein [Oscillospiraceae bacterium]
MMKLRRCAAAALAVMLSVSALYGETFVYAEDNSDAKAVSDETNPKNTVYINSAEDFVSFAENCRLDSYSRGKTFILGADINFSSSQTDFIPVPSFSGTFEGNGHKISGFSVESNGSAQGLFRYIEKSGRVMDLNVSCKISPSGTSSKCGAVAGVNRGTIYGCSFDGVVTGKEYCGGIAGVNEETGLISCCKANGRIQSKHFTGGIAGENRGCIMLCENSASVNTNVSDNALDLENINIDDIYSTENSRDSTDAGGIVGYSSGNIQKCVNKGDVGYAHIGYNIGGICGRQNGYISGCENYGTINGRKDTGGVAGQAEPHFSLLFSESSVQKLRDRLDELNVIVDKTIDDLNGSSDTLSGNTDKMIDSLKAVKSDTTDLLDETDSIINENIDSVNELSSRVSDLIDMSEPVTDSFSKASDSLTEAVDKLWEANDLLAEAMGDSDEAMDILFPALDDLSEAVESLKNANDSMQDGLSSAQNSLGDPNGLSASLNKLKNDLYILGQSVQTIRDIIYSTVTALDDITSSSENEEALNKIKDSLSALQDSADRVSEQISSADAAVRRLQELLDSDIDNPAEYRECISEILDVFTGGAFEDMFDALSDLTEGMGMLIDTSAAESFKDEISRCASVIRNQTSANSTTGAANGEEISLDSLAEIIDHLMETSSSLGDVENSTGSLIDRVKEAWPFLDDSAAAAIAAAYAAEEAVQYSEDASVYLSDGLGYLHDITEYFSGKEEISFTGTGENFEAVRSSLSDNIETLLDDLDVLNGSAGDSVNILSEDLKALNSKASEVYDVIIDMTEEMTENPKSLGDYTEDISASDTEGRADGKIASCKNYGEIYADVSAGGIVGAMGVENSFDPEGDIEQKGDRSFDFMYQSRTVVRDCVNSGGVTSKKDGAGGIAGMMDTGCIINCNGYGNVSSTDGSYVGGIAGKSSAAIFGSSAMCRLEGDDYVGGIAGSGHDISSCKSFVSIDLSDEYSGAVAGDCDGETEGNIFAENGTGGIDGISYDGKAYPVSYEEMAAMEDVPEEFKTLTLTFVADGRTVDTISFKYGESLSESDIPEAPRKSGCFAKWSEHDYSNMTYSAVIEAEYIPLVTSISSEITGESGRPVFIAEGSFTDMDKLEVTDLGNESWEVHIPEDSNTERLIRFLPVTKPDKTVIKLDGEEVPCETDGSYVVFAASGSSLVISASEKPFNMAAVGGAACGIAAAAAALAAVIHKKKKSKSK